MFGAWPQNAFALRELQQRLAESCGKKVGSLTTVSHFAWIDENDAPLAQKILEENDEVTCQWDPRGNFIVDIEGNEIVARHLTPEGKELREFRIDGKKPKAARDLVDQIISELAVSELSHAADLGRQIARAEAAVKLGLKFKQDQPLERTN